jgi:hypothetical protein
MLIYSIRAPEAYNSCHWKQQVSEIRSAQMEKDVDHFGKEIWFARSMGRNP